MRAALRIAVLALALAVPAAASSVPRTTPPGVSELDQYSETVLGAGGEQTLTPPGNGAGSVLSPSTEQELQQLGPAGEATVRLANQTAPPRTGSGPGSGGDAGSGFGAFTDALGGSGDGGIGLLLPLILAAIAAAGLAYAFLRRRAHQPG